MSSSVAVGTGVPAEVDAELVAQLTAAIMAQGNVVRQLKVDGAPQADIDAAVAALKEHKAALTSVDPSSSLKDVASNKKNKKAKAANATPAVDPNAPKAEETPEQKAKKARKAAEKAAKLAKLEAKKKKQQQEQAAAKSSGGSKKKSAEKKAAPVVIDKTPPGEKKLLDVLPDQYDPQYVESAWYAWWEKEGFFKPEVGGKIPEDKEKFVMPIPPPNVTGVLHLGHALTNSIEDAVARWHRMNGKVTLWNPGCDHAGIATQVVVEKKLKREENKSRHDVGREEFVKRCYQFKETKANIIYDQLKKLGSSFDWDRAKFTMDPSMCTAVTEAFVRMHDKGTIYRSTRLVNWSCHLKSAISDVEVDSIELTGRTMRKVPGHKDKEYEFGVMISFAYKVEGMDEELIVATTRIETMLGDVAVVVHPKDTRYTHLHGKFVIHPFTGQRLPILLDDILVDMELGTGAVKITPAHDPKDNECGIRHGLEIINILNDDGTMNENCAQFANMMRYDAREAVIEALTDLGLYRGKEDNAMQLPVCSRSNDIIEPRLKPQWFVNIDNMSARAIEAVRSKEITITPSMHEITWYRWLEEPRPWCISRQLWWGHRIPAYFVTVKGREGEFDRANGDHWVSGRTDEEARLRAATKFGADIADVVLAQDEDVLDTWFSSGIFPFSMFGWPNKTPDLSAFFPNTLLETGHDIIFFWVARMVMMSLELLDVVPFKEIFLHPMVRDAHGEKMSKSKGNVIDPLHVMKGVSLEDLHKSLEGGNLEAHQIAVACEGQKQDYPNGIPQCGADALRFTLCSYTTPNARNINLDVQRIVGYRHFCNKLWNAYKFFKFFAGDAFVPAVDEGTAQADDLCVDKWILHRLGVCIATANKAFKNYDFMTLSEALNLFLRNDICDKYIEAIKPRVSKKIGRHDRALEILYTCLENGFRLLAPIMPFLCEELWQRLPRRKSDTSPSTCVAPYPTRNDLCDDAAHKAFDMAFDFVTEARSVKKVYLEDRQQPATYVQCGPVLASAVADLNETILALANLKSIAILAPGEEAPEGCAASPIGSGAVLYVMVKGLVDPVKELKRLEKKRKEVGQVVETLKVAMGRDTYAAKVPANIREQNDQKLGDGLAELDSLFKSITWFQSLQDQA